MPDEPKTKADENGDPNPENFDWDESPASPREKLVQADLYNPDQAQDRTRENLAVGLVLLLALTVGGIIWYVGSGRLDGTSLVQSVFPSLVTLVGTALGFYFGTRTKGGKPDGS